MDGLVKFKCDDSDFSRMVKEFGAVALMGIGDAFREQSMLLADELVKRTPPFSGKSLKRMLEARMQNKALANANGAMGPFSAPAVFSDPDIESMSALAVGKRRVEKDIRRVIYGVRGATMPARSNPIQIHAQTNPNAAYGGKYMDWGVAQKCQNKGAVRIYATKDGEVYGVDFERFKADATVGDMKKTHNEHRGARGRVTTAGERDLIVGRWRWLNVLVTKEALVKEFVKLNQKMVGQGRGGWAVSFVKLGGKLSPSGWVGKHAFGKGVAVAGTCDASFKSGDVRIKMVNQSQWARGGDPDRIIEAAMAGRAKAIAGDIRRRLEKAWGNKARRRAEAAAKQAA